MATTAAGTAAKAAGRRLVLAGLVALLVAGGLGLGGRGAAAFTKVLRSDDGKLVLVCHYDDRTGELAFCDVYWFPLTVEGGAAGATGVTGSVGKVDAGALAVQGEQVAVEQGAVRGLPAGAELSGGAAGSAEAGAAVQAVKHPGKGKGSGHGKHGKAGRK